MTAIDNLTSSVKPSVETIQALPKKGVSPDGRYSGYIGNLISSFGWDQKEEPLQ